MTERRPFRRGDRVRSTLQRMGPFTGTCDADERGGFVAVRWDGARGAQVQRAATLEHVTG